MARQLVEKYIFSPNVAGQGTVKFPGKVDLTQLLIIANKTQQTNIYAIGDPTKNGSISYDPFDTTFSGGSDQFSEQVGSSTVVFAADTSTMLPTDKLSIYSDAPKQIGNIVRPYAFGVDAIERMRTANPTSLIDADFEYGLQPTKWQNYSEIRGVPGIYEKPGLDLFITNIVSDGGNPSVMTVTCSEAHGLSAATPVLVFGCAGVANAARSEGAFVINNVPSSTTFTYFAKGIVGVNGTSVYNQSTYARRGGFYAGAELPITSYVSDGNSPSKITVTTTAPHGLVPASPIVNVVTSSGTNHSLVAGNFFIETTPSPNSFTFTSRVGGAVASAGIVAKTYTRSDAFVQHRPFDGGVNLGTFLPSHGASVSRQTKKYMRYQSGKGILWTSGVLFNPVINLDQISASATTVGSVITVSAEIDHGLQAGAIIEISGVVTSGYNGVYGVVSVVNESTFTVAANVALGSTSAVITNLPRITVKNWIGATTRVGPFDDQNGLFWEFDGQELAVVKRSATYQLSGFVSVNSGSQLVTGNACRFTQQLKVGDSIVIRGMTYRVGTITDDNTMTINPEYRGVNNSSGIKIAHVIDQRVPKSQFNCDKIDGTGISGYNINLNKMQMLGISFSWYGAGFIDFMCRGPDGNMILVHRMKQNNLNDEAYMRTGNSAVRYQAINESARDRLFTTLNSTDTSVTLYDASRFPSTGGTILIENECINYTGKAGNTLTGCTRGASYSLFVGGSNKQFTGGPAASHTTGNGFQAVTLISCTCSPIVNHWGSSYIMDGGFDSDRGYYFNYAATSQSLTANQNRTVFFLRLAPSVSNSIAGAFGDRDLINRSQLLLQKLQVTATQNVQVYGILNPGNIDASSLTWSAVNSTALGSQPSFAQISTSTTTAATPGEQNFSTLAQINGFAEIDLSNLKELTNSAIGGYSNYPDGPDVLAIVIRNLSATNATFNINLFWSEAQA